MAQTYRGHILTEAFADQVAVYDRGTFRGHFPSFHEAQLFVDGRLQSEWRGE